MTLKFDPESLANGIQTLVDSESFVDEHSKEQVIKVLELCELTIQQTITLYTNLARKFDAIQLFEIFQHTSVLFSQDLNSIRRLLNLLSKKLGADFFGNLSTYLQLYSPNADNEAANEEIKKLKQTIAQKDQEIAECQQICAKQEQQIDKNLPANSPQAQNTKPNENLEKLKQLAKNAANFYNIYNLLNECANQGDDETIKYAVQNNFHEIRNDYHARNILIQTEVKTDIKLAAKLIEYGADPNARDSAGLTLLYHLCHKGNIDAVKILAGMPKIDINAPTKNGSTTLMISCRDNHVEIVEYLLTVPGINVNLRDKIGLTALNYATNERIRTLIKNKA